MHGIPQLKSKGGELLNSPLTKLKLEKYKNEVVSDLIKIDDSYENKITDNNIIYNDSTNYRTKKSILNKNRDGFFLTGVAGGNHEKKVDFLLADINRETTDTFENIFHNDHNHYNNHKRTDTKSNAGLSSKSIHNINVKKDSNKSIYNLQTQNFGNTKDKKPTNILGVMTFGLKEKNIKNNANPHENFIKTNEYYFNNQNKNNNDDSDLLSDENKYLSITKKNKINKLKSLESFNSIKGPYNTQENYNYNYINNLNSENKENLDKLKNKTDFFKMSLKTRSLKNLQNPKVAKKEKKFLKTNYLSAMNDFLSAVNTEVDYYTQTFTGIEKGIKNFDHIQSVHVNIPPDKLMDKKMMYNDEKFVRKYFIYGTQGGQFISEDKQNDDIIERSDNLAKITPEISYKFKKMILDRFSEKPLVDFTKFLEPNSYKMQKFKENSKKVAMLIDDTDKRRARVENDLSKFFLKTKEN